VSARAGICVAQVEVLLQDEPRRSEPWRAGQSRFTDDDYRPVESHLHPSWVVGRCKALPDKGNKQRADSSGREH
jgi:hypothetical protein